MHRHEDQQRRGACSSSQSKANKRNRCESIQCIQCIQRLYLIKATQHSDDSGINENNAMIVMHSRKPHGIVTKEQRSKWNAVVWIG